MVQSRGPRFWAERSARRLLEAAEEEAVLLVAFPCKLEQSLFCLSLADPFYELAYWAWKCDAEGILKHSFLSI